jgi:hypothetical protein
MGVVGSGREFSALFDDLIRPQQQRRRDGEDEGLGRLHVDEHLELRRLGIVSGTLRSAVRTHRELALENLALRQQLAV